MKSKHSKYSAARGSATVELAVCLPLMVLLVFASIEGASMLFLRQAVVQSAYEPAKSVAKTNGVQVRAVRLGEQVLTSRGVVSPTIVFAPRNVQRLAPGTPQNRSPATIPSGHSDVATGALKSPQSAGPHHAP